MNKEEFKRTLRKFLKNPSAMIGMTLLLIFAVIAIIAPIIAPPEVPKSKELETVKDLLAGYTVDKEDEIITNLSDYYITYGFYVELKSANDKIRTVLTDYKNGKIEENVLQQTISEAEDYTIMDFGKVFEPEFMDKKVFDFKNLTPAEQRKKVIEKYIVNEGIKYLDDFNKKYISAAEMKRLLDAVKKGDANFRANAQATLDNFQKVFSKDTSFDPYVMKRYSNEERPKAPTKDHSFGMVNGYDIYYGVVWGTRTAFIIGLTVVIISTLVGLFLGSVGAYFGGWVDEVIMRITDIFMSVPFMLSAMVLTTILGTGLDKVMIALIVFGWMGPARLIRASIFQTKNEQFVLAAKALGVSDGKIIIKHILPNTIFPVIVQASMRIGNMVIAAAGLSFLGLGAPQGYSDWGSILSYARNWITDLGQYWYTIVFPGVAMTLFVLAWNLVGDAVRDIFDPKLRM